MRRRIIWLSVIATVLLAIIWAALPGRYVATLGGNRTLMLEHVSFGKTNRLDYGGFLPDAIRQRLPPRWKSSFPATASVSRSTTEDELSGWLTLRDDQGAYLSVSGTRIEITDEHGCVLGSFTDRTKTTSSPAWFHFTSFPRQQKKFHCRVFDAKNASLAEWLVENPAYRRQPEWQPQSLPVTVTNGNWAFSLTGFQVHTNYPFPFVSPVITTYHDGKPRTDAYYAGSTWSDASGNRASEANRLCPQESAWKLTSRFVVNYSGPVVQLSSLMPGTIVSLGDTQTIHGVTIELVSIRTPAALTGARPNQTGTSAVPNIAKAADPSGSIRSALDDAYLAVRLRGLGPNQQLSMLLKDTRGQPYDAYLKVIETGLNIFPLSIPNSKQIATLQFLVQQSYEPEFFVKPPKP